MALPQDGQNANALATVKEVPTGKKLIFVDPTTNEGGIITLEDLTTQILKKLTSQTFALDQGTKTLPAALNELNSKTLIITISGSTDSTGNIRINVPNSFSRMPYVVTNIRDNLLFYVVTICPSAVHPVGCYYFTNSNNYQSSIPSEWNVDAECPRRYSKVFVYYNCVFTSTEKSNFVAVWNLVGGVTCITGKTVTIL